MNFWLSVLYPAPGTESEVDYCTHDGKHCRRRASLAEAIKPVVPAFRERFVNKQILAHLEQAAKRYEAWSERRTPGHIAAMRQFIQQMRGQAAAAAKA